VARWRCRSFLRDWSVGIDRISHISADELRGPMANGGMAARMRRLCRDPFPQEADEDTLEQV